MPFDFGSNLSCPSTSRTAPLNVESSQNQCITIWDPVQLRQEWTIHNINKALELSTPGICMRSRCFRDESMPDIAWQVNISLNLTVFQKISPFLVVFVSRRQT